MTKGSILVVCPCSFYGSSILSRILLGQRRENNIVSARWMYAMLCCILQCQRRGNTLFILPNKLVCQLYIYMDTTPLGLQIICTCVAWMIYASGYAIFSIAQKHCSIFFEIGNTRTGITTLPKMKIESISWFWDTAILSKFFFLEGTQQLVGESPTTSFF